MSDNEIIKALEQCETQKSCSDCPYFEKIGCKKHLYQNALDLINRLQADCENYKQVAENQQSVTMDRGFEIKRLKEKIESLQAENTELLGKIEQLKNDKAHIASDNAYFQSVIQNLEAEVEKLKAQLEGIKYGE